MSPSVVSGYADASTRRKFPRSEFAAILLFVRSSLGVVGLKGRRECMGTVALSFIFINVRKSLIGWRRKHAADEPNCHRADYFWLSSSPCRTEKAPRALTDRLSSRPRASYQVHFAANSITCTTNGWLGGKPFPLKLCEACCEKEIVFFCSFWFKYPRRLPSQRRHR